MKKKINKAPFIFAIVYAILVIISHSLYLEQNLLLISFEIFIGYLSLWLFIEWLLSRSENKLLRWIIAIVAALIYTILFIGLDYYVFHLVTHTQTLPPLKAIKGMLSIIMVVVIFIESNKWSKAREKAQIENLRLQAENIETKFELLKEQVNPEFLFYCLKTLQNMVRINDPQTETYILKLADVYRQMLKRNRNSITFGEELNNLKIYLYLMCYGRETTIQYDINVLEVSLNYKLPSFALLSLIDKCMKHNELSSENPLYILIYQNNEQSVTVTDNYQQKVSIPSTNMLQLEQQYELEGIENGIVTKIESSTYSSTLKLF